MTRDFFLGIDGGGTKTAAVLVDGDGHELARAVSGPSNYHSVGEAVAEASLRQVIGDVLSRAGLAATAVTAAGLGMAGAARARDREVIGAMLSRVALFRRAVIVTDAEAALVGGIGRRYGAVVIAGTGAIAHGINARGESRRADGWGFLLGDEGSARWIGLHGLRAVVQAHDGRGPETALGDPLFAHLGVSDLDTLVAHVYAPDFGVPQLAGLASVVSQVAQDGDAVAQQLLRQAGERLSESLRAVVNGLKMNDEVFDVVLTGGVLHGRGLVWQTVVAALRTIAPLAQPIEPRHDAAMGAALLARQGGA